MYKARKGTVKKGMKRYVARQNRVTRPMQDSDSMILKCEAYDQLICASGSPVPTSITSGNTFTNVLTLLTGSTSWQDNQPLYSRYKITGISLRASPGASVATLDAAFPNCAPTISTAFYPQLTSSVLGTNPAYNDQKMLIDPAISTPQSKYWKFIDNYFDNGASGFGVWTSTQSGVQTGQFSHTFNIPSNATANTGLFNLRYTFYILFATRNK